VELGFLHALSVTPGPVALDDAACGPQPGLALAGARTLTVGRSSAGVAVRASGVGPPPVVEVMGGPDTVLGRRTEISASSQASGRADRRSAAREGHCST
jgi:hypothetical protein